MLLTMTAMLDSRAYQCTHMLEKGSRKLATLERMAESMTKNARENTKTRTILRLSDNDDRRRSGNGIDRIKTSEERLNTRFVRR